MKVYQVLLVTAPKVYRPMFMSFNQIDLIDKQARGRGLPKGATINAKFEDGTVVSCVDILVEYNVPIGRGS